MRTSRVFVALSIENTPRPHEKNCARTNFHRPGVLSQPFGYLPQTIQAYCRTMFLVAARYWSRVISLAPG